MTAERLQEQIDEMLFFLHNLKFGYTLNEARILVIENVGRLAKNYAIEGEYANNPYGKWISINDTKPNHGQGIIARTTATPFMVSDVLVGQCEVINSTYYCNGKQFFDWVSQ